SLSLDTGKFASAKVVPGCYLVVAAVGTLTPAVSKEKVLIPAKPKIASAKKTADGKSVQVEGKEFISTKDCGGSDLSFDLVDEATAAKTTTVTPMLTAGNSIQVTFALPTTPATAKYNQIAS